MLKLIRPKVNMAVILLVDENPLRAAMRQSLLEGATPDVVRVSSPAEALCMVESEKFTQSLRLVVTGSQVPGVNGAEFVTELRARMPQVDVLVLTGNEARPSGQEDSPGVYYVSAQSPEEMRATVNGLLHGSSRQTA